MNLVKAKQLKMYKFLVFAFQVCLCTCGAAFAQGLPKPSLSIDFDPVSLEKIGAQYPDGQKFSFVEGKDGRPAVEFHGFNRSSVIKIPNSEKIQFTDGVTFDLWVKVYGDEGMDGWGNLIQSGGNMTFLAKSHGRNGFILASEKNEIFPPYGNGFFDSEDLTWKRRYCNKDPSFRAVEFGQWYRLTAVASSKRGTFIFINKNLVSSCLNARPSFKASNEQDLFIGRFKDKWYPLHGLIQDLRIYQVALTPEQVKDLP